MPSLRVAFTLGLMAFASQVVAAACPPAAAWPPPFRLDYEVKATRAFLSLRGDSVLQLTRADGGYTLVSDTQAGKWYGAHQSSRGQLSTGGLVPAEYLERNGNRPQKTTHLDWREERVTFSATDEVVPTQPHMQDRLSLLLQLGWAARGRATPAAVEMPVAGVRRAKLYRFELRGAEAVETPAGRFQALKFERPMDEDDDRLEIWLAPALCHLPVRLRFTDHKGQVIENELKQATLR